MKQVVNLNEEHADSIAPRQPGFAARFVRVLSSFSRLVGLRQQTNPLFDRRWYLWQYPDVRASGVDPYEHYLRHGASEGRDPNPLFDTDWYLERNPDVRDAGINPLDHFLLVGGAEGRDPHPLFSISWYLAQNPEVDKKKTNPLIHYFRLSRSSKKKSWIF